MKKRMLCGLLAALLLLLCACSPSITVPEDFPYEVDKQGYAIVTEPAWGFSIGVPFEAIDKSLVQLAATPLEYADEEYPVPGVYRLDLHYLAPELWDVLDSGDESVTDEDLMGYVRQLLVMHIFSANDLDAKLAAGQTLDAIAGESGAKEVGRQQDYAYVVAKYDEPTDTLSSASKSQYKKLVTQLPKMIERIGMIDIVAPEPTDAQQSIPPFQATDLSGAFVTNAIFATKNLTMVNIWGTFCEPCIEEMPDLGKLAADMPEGTQLVGIIVDAQGNTDLATEILTTANATEGFPQIVPDETLSAFLADYQFVPTTLFVDALGQIVGDPIEGALGEAEYRKALEERLLSVMELR